MKPSINLKNQLAGGNGYLNKIVSDILQLEHQLNHPEEQTWYFKSGLQSKMDRLDALVKQFKTFKNNVNDISAEELSALLLVEEQKMTEINSLNCSRCSRIIASSISRNRITKFQSYIEIKNKVGEIPDLSFYRDNSELTHLSL